MNRRSILLSLALSTLALPALAQEKRYAPTWESLDSRPIPAWFDEAKFGIFIHWGLYSVPAWGPKGQYAEWYWHSMNDPKNPTRAYHDRTYGAGFKYQDFAPRFKAELYNPDEWASIFARSGAKYVVLTSKHHEGFCLWPSAQSWNWNSVDAGPHRDLLGDLTKSVRAKGLKMGIYYSLYEWYNPLYRADPKAYVEQHMLPQLKDVVQRYQPSLIFSDGEWEHPSDTWRSTEFLAWLYNESAAKDDVVVNDRWGKETRAAHGGYFTSEYGSVGGGKQLGAGHKWEENQGIGASFGYNRNESLDDYKSGADLVKMLVRIVASGGNLLLDVGPTADGRIPVIMQQRLAEIGDWLKLNGEAIYGTHSWRVHSENKELWYTAKNDAVYALSLTKPEREVVLTVPKTGKATTITLLGREEPLKWRQTGGQVHVEIPATAIAAMPARPAYVFKLTGVQ